MNEQSIQSAEQREEEAIAEFRQWFDKGGDFPDLFDEVLDAVRAAAKLRAELAASEPVKHNGD